MDPIFHEIRNPATPGLALLTMRGDLCPSYPVKFLSPIFFLVEFLAFLFLLAPSWAASPFESCASFLGPTDSLLISDLKGNHYARHNAGIPRVPASTIKLLTSLAAIHLLGPEHRFKTDFLLDQNGNLIMKGYGDPLLISEVLSDIAFKISNEVKGIKNLIVDDSFFEKPISIPGRSTSSNPYDAPIGAVCANFNTVFFKKTSRGHLVSAEPQTPLIPFARQRILARKLKAGRYTLSHDPDDPPRYAGELLACFLKQNGVEVRGNVRIGQVHGQARPLFTYRSPFTLEQVLARMLEFSNNFMANQILVYMGAIESGPPGTLIKGLEVVRDYARKGLGIEKLWLVEGSGISRRNRISALEMHKILREFAPFRRLLKKRGILLSKSGTLRGIRNLVGYVEQHSSQGPLLFVIFTRGEGKSLEKAKRCIIGKATDSATIH